MYVEEEDLPTLAYDVAPVQKKPQPAPQDDEDILPTLAYDFNGTLDQHLELVEAKPEVKPKPDNKQKQNPIKKAASTLDNSDTDDDDTYKIE